MNAIKTVRRLISTEPASEAARTLARLVLALESETEFDIASLYTLDLKAFELSMAILKEWRIDRYYAAKGKLLDLSYQLEHSGSS